jgi:hypothetical protein
MPEVSSAVSTRQEPISKPTDAEAHATKKQRRGIDDRLVVLGGAGELKRFASYDC